MKKLTMLFAAVLFAAFSFGQNTATTTVTGDHNNSDIDQSGSLQTTTVTQDGDYNKSDVDQDNTADAPSIVAPQVATVYQEGNRNDAKIDMNMKKGNSSSQGNYAEIDQIGDWNTSTQLFKIDYNNKSNSADGDQSGNHNELIQIIDGGHNQGLDADQLGNYNDAYQKSSGSAIRGKVYQMGDHNDATQKLKSRSLGHYTTPSGGPILIEQVGDRNIGYQDFDGKNISGRIYQTGDWNESRQYIDGQMDETFVEIDGDRNYTRQVIDGGWNGNGLVSNFSEVYLDGNWNDVRTKQVGSFNWARVDINGDVWGHHGDADRNDVDVDQIGDYNTLTFVIPRGDYTGDYNDLNADQTGNGHGHRIGVDGSHNDIDIVATGNVGGSQYAGNKGDWNFYDDDPWNETSSNNKLYLRQDGTRNYATGSVAGDHNDIDIRQNGNDNLVGSNWYDHDGVVIDGDRNTVDVRQTGMGHSATVNISGNWNTSSTTQN